jgi:hypothetical protein
MFNATPPSPDDLPGAGRLLRSTLIAAGVGALLVVTVLLPAEYAVDPLRIGRVLGLTQMGEIKRQLVAEQAADATRGPTLATIEQRMVALEEQMRRLEPLVAAASAVRPPPAAAAVPPAAVQAPAAAARPAPPPGARSDETVIALQPDQGLEVKLRMRRGAQARYAWTVANGHVNFDAHGEPPNATRGFYHGYAQGRAATADQGVLVAAFDGTHGWFFRNRSGRAVRVTLRTEGDYEAVIRP